MSDATLLYLVGAPATGKTTTMGVLTSRWIPVERAKPVPHLAYLTSSYELAALEIGRRRKHFAGTDALAMNISPQACSWIASRPADLVLGEGQRLATRPFFHAAADAGYRVKVVYLVASPVTLDGRCLARGSKQSVAWRRGAETRAARIALYAYEQGWPVLRVSTEGTQPEQAAAAVSEWLEQP